ncbi:MAG: GGDEF domain-containing response regulator [Rhodocyclaceae bacterium]|nr:GGDEF domain-containing response regulator [Rhodocyclaceae bacterium]MBX3678407.1 GGDEF domain-containing response regulator [Rhodocyclaceae bacterium]MCB1891918.1 GGDEF domain-containing response regulator [Rhodocyclaceae bacterium]MCP5297834.1 GGDEF domain-containing response regulator [Zoogloeaceae bacterium]MCW5596393.1 GGDEF domain-containing response regulator [Rhodocyclaceae bacterium]
MERANRNMLLREQPISMLIVDDSEDDAFLLFSELASRGAKVDFKRVDTAPDMSAALNGGNWDLIICDHSMPGFDALTALEVLKQSGKDIPFIIYSGHISDQTAYTAMGDGVNDYIQKGNYARLIPVIERELKGAAARSAVRKADSRIMELAYFDKLSSLPNHNYFCARVTELIAECEQLGKAPGGALFYIDLDRFLRINSSFGYEAGNEILRQSAARLKECAAESGAILARFGGDEFGIYYPGLTDKAAVQNFAEWLKQAFDAPFMLAGIELFLTCSIGIALVPDHGTQVYDLLMNAETAMANAKRGGSNGYRFYVKEMNATSAERIAMESELRHAIERNELFLQYQPCVDATSLNTIGVEALVRWRHPERGLIPPDRFIPIADESGLIVDIGEWVLRQACRQAKVWHDLGLQEFSISVNVSAVQFAQPRLLDVVNRALADSGLPPQALTLEITESVVMHDAETAVGMLRALKHMGVKLSIDDFGTGYSSLSYLRRFPIDILKIDKSFVGTLGVNEEDTAIVRAIMALAKSLRLTTIAEGVETERQVELLQREQCDRFQGYHFSRPIDIDSLTARLLGEQRLDNALLH